MLSALISKSEITGSGDSFWNDITSTGPSDSTRRVTKSSVSIDNWPDWPYTPMNTCHSVFFVCVFLFHNRGRVAVALGMTSEHWAAALTHVTVSECSPAGVYSKLYFVSVLFNLFGMFSASCHRLLEGWNNCFRRKAPKNAFGEPVEGGIFYFLLFKEKRKWLHFTCFIISHRTTSNNDILSRLTWL